MGIAILHQWKQTAFSEMLVLILRTTWKSKKPWYILTIFISFFTIIIINTYKWRYLSHFNSYTTNRIVMLNIGLSTIYFCKKTFLHCIIFYQLIY